MGNITTSPHQKAQFIQIDPTQQCRLIDQTQYYKVYINSSGVQYEKYLITKNTHQLSSKFKSKQYNSSQSVLNNKYKTQNISNQSSTSIKSSCSSQLCSDQYSSNTNNNTNNNNNNNMNLQSHKSSSSFQQQYQYRLTHRSKYFVQLLYAAPLNQSFNCTFTQPTYSVVTQRILYRLTQLYNLSFNNALSILYTGLRGFMNLFIYNGSFWIKDTMIGVNQLDEIKVWLNSNYGVNYVQQLPKSIQRLSVQQQQDMIVNNFIDMVSSKTNQCNQWKQFMKTRIQIQIINYDVNNNNNKKIDNNNDDNRVGNNKMSFIKGIQLVQMVMRINKLQHLIDNNKVSDLFNQQLEDNKEKMIMVNNKVVNNINSNELSNKLFSNPFLVKNTHSDESIATVNKYFSNNNSNGLILNSQSLINNNTINSSRVNNNNTFSQLRNNIMGNNHNINHINHNINHNINQNINHNINNNINQNNHKIDNSAILKKSNNINQSHLKQIRNSITNHNTIYNPTTNQINHNHQPQKYHPFNKNNNNIYLNNNQNNTPNNHQHNNNNTHQHNNIHLNQSNINSKTIRSTSNPTINLTYRQSPHTNINTNTNTYTNIPQRQSYRNVIINNNPYHRQSSNSPVVRFTQSMDKPIIVNHKNNNNNNNNNKQIKVNFLNNSLIRYSPSYQRQSINTISQPIRQSINSLRSSQHSLRQSLRQSSNYTVKSSNSIKQSNHTVKEQKELRHSELIFDNSPVKYHKIQKSNSRIQTIKDKDKQKQPLSISIKEIQKYEQQKLSNQQLNKLQSEQINISLGSLQKLQQLRQQIESKQHLNSQLQIITQNKQDNNNEQPYTDVNKIQDGHDRVQSNNNDDKQQQGIRVTINQCMTPEQSQQVSSSSNLSSELIYQQPAYQIHQQKDSINNKVTSLHNPVDSIDDKVKSSSSSAQIQIYRFKLKPTTHIFNQQQQQQNKYQQQNNQYQYQQNITESQQSQHQLQYQQNNNQQQQRHISQSLQKQKQQYNNITQINQNKPQHSLKSPSQSYTIINKLNKWQNTQQLQHSQQSIYHKQQDLNNNNKNNNNNNNNTINNNTKPMTRFKKQLSHKQQPLISKNLYIDNYPLNYSTRQIQKIYIPGSNQLIKVDNINQQHQYQTIAVLKTNTNQNNQNNLNNLNKQNDNNKTIDINISKKTTINKINELHNTMNKLPNKIDKLSYKQLRDLLKSTATNYSSSAEQNY